MPSWSLGTRGVFPFEGIPDSDSVCGPCIVNQQMEQLTLPLLTESRISSPSSSQRWCPHNLPVSKVVVKGFAALAVLLLWAVLPWCAFSFLQVRVQTKAVVQTVHLFLFAACGSSLIFVSTACIHCLVVCPLLHILASKWCSLLPSYSSILCAELRSAVIHCCCFQVCLTQTVRHTLMYFIDTIMVFLM